MSFVFNHDHDIAYLEDVDSPALVVYKHVVEQNIDKAINIVGDVHKLRPHVKTVKSVEVIQLAIEKGITKFKCSTISEAEMLCIAGAKDILINYQMSSVKINRVRHLRSKYPQVELATLIDNYDSALTASTAFSDDPLSVYIDLNVGMNRTGIVLESVIQLMWNVAALSGISVKGLHVYDGHIDSSHDMARANQARETLTSVNELRQKLNEEFDSAMKLVIGGSPTFSLYCSSDDLEVSPGTFFFWDAGYGSAYPEIPFQPAAFLLCRVLSIVDTRTLCLDLGYKATASDQPLPRVFFPDIRDYEVIDQYEEHIIIKVNDSSRYTVGQPLFAIPFHICPTVNLYEDLLVGSKNGIVDSWRVVARDRKISI